MTESTDIAAFLSRVSNDLAFRELLEADPDAAMDQYDLPADVRALARRRDGAALALLSWSARGEAPPERRADRPAATPAELGLGDALPPVEIVLRLAPTAVTNPDGSERIAHTVSLHPKPVDGEPLAGLAPDAPPGARFVIRVAPLATPTPDGLVQLSYAASIAPVGADRDPSLVPDTAVPTDPWSHDRGPGPQAIADRVRAADPDDRYPLLLELIAAMTAHSGAR